MDKIIKDFLKRLNRPKQNQAPAENQVGEWKELERIWEWSGDYRQEGPSIDLESNLHRFKQRIRQETSTRRLTLRPYLLSAAAVILLLLAGAWLFRQQLFSEKPELILVEHTGTPAKSLELSDGSRITLYDGSSIEYPRDFSPKTDRKINLKGQARFEVRSRIDQAFIVQTPHTRVEVLGTRFLVQDQPEGTKAIVQVEEGQVRFLDESSGGSIILEAAEIGVCQAGGYLHKRPMSGDLEAPLQPVFRARGGPLSQMVNQWEWWTDLTFSISPSAADCPLSNDFDLTDTQNTLAKLELLGFKVEQTGDLQYRIDGGCKQPGR